MPLRSTTARALGAALCALQATACGHAAPPSRFPNGQALLDRMRASYACANGARGEAKIDYFSRAGRVRGKLMFYAVMPERVRFDALSPFGVTLSTLTSDGRAFALYDLREKRFFRGPASACNLARLTHVPIPGHALVALLHGEAPLLVHAPDAVSLTWSSRGYYVLTVPSTRGASEELHVVPSPSDFAKPFAEQRLRLLDLRVTQRGYDLYHAELKDYAPASTAPADIDETGIEPPLPPSGPECTAEVPRALHLEVPGTGDDVLLRYEAIALNPPLPENVFEQPIPGGVQVVGVGACDTE